MQDSLTFDEMFEDLEMVGSDETAMRTFLTSEITAPRQGAGPVTASRPTARSTARAA